MTTTNSVTSTNWWKTPTSTETSSTAGGNNLSDFDSFIQLLATELQYQDPTDPVDSSEYVSQMAQISSLQQLQNIYTSVDSTKAYNMLGKTVAYQQTDSSGNTYTQTGTVQAVTTQNNYTYLNIDGTLVNLSSVFSVSDQTASAT